MLADGNSILKHRNIVMVHNIHILQTIEHELTNPGRFKIITNLATVTDQGGVLGVYTPPERISSPCFLKYFPKIFLVFNVEQVVHPLIKTILD